MRKEFIKYVNLNIQWQFEKKKLLKIIDKTISNDDWVNGSEVKKFENNILKKTNSKYAVALNSGTDALTLALHLVGVKKGDEVITPPNSFISSTSSIIHIGAKPVFADVCQDQNINPEQIEKSITKKTKAIMTVHLTGRISNIDKILKISKKYSIPIIEDAAQAIGSKFNNKMAGSFGDISCFSCHPLKNLNGIGDGGFLATNKKQLAIKAKMLSNHGFKNRNKLDDFGFLSRMDSVQAAILNFRLKNLNNVIIQRRKNFKIYEKYLDKKNIFFPKELDSQYNTYHTFVIQTPNRDKLIKYLYKKGIQSAIHYPIPIHLQKAAKFLGYKEGSFPVTEHQAKTILTLPIHQFLKNDEIKYISKTVNNFFK